MKEQLKDRDLFRKQPIRMIRTTDQTLLFGRPLITRTHETVREVVYEDIDVGLKERIKKVVKEIPSIPKKLRFHTESFISGIYADVKDSWNAENVGDVSGIQQRAGYRVETDQAQKTIGKTLYDERILPETLQNICNDVFSTSEGKFNKNFQEFLLGWINMRMGIMVENEEPLKDENF